jgi:transposase InsO family protein
MTGQIYCTLIRREAPELSIMWLTRKGVSHAPTQMGRENQSMVESLERWIADYNEHYLHSALGYKTPRQFERDYHCGRSTQFARA